MTLITFLYSRIIKLIVDSDNIFKGGNSMASSSIFIYELRSPAEINVESIYSRLKGYPEDENTYFNLEMISANELLGEYVIVQNAQESYYNPEQRVFEYRIVPKANVISFSITDDFLEIWGNKTSANKLVFELSNLLAPISINSVEVSAEKSADNLIWVPLYVTCFFSLAAFKIFSLRKILLATLLWIFHRMEMLFLSYRNIMIKFQA